MYRYLCITCRERDDEVLIRLQSNGVPNYCPKLKYYEKIASADSGDDEASDKADDISVHSDVDFDVVANQSLDPAIESWGVDIELSWNKVVDPEDGNIK